MECLVIYIKKNSKSFIKHRTISFVCYEYKFLCLKPVHKIHVPAGKDVLREGKGYQIRRNLENVILSLNWIGRREVRRKVISYNPTYVLRHACVLYTNFNITMLLVHIKILILTQMSNILQILHRPEFLQCKTII